MKKIQRIFISLISLLCFMSFSLLAQGVTTSELAGSVSEADAAGLEGANIVATHEPSGIILHAAVVFLIYPICVWADHTL